MNDNQKNIENAFYSDGYKFGMKVVESNNNKVVLFKSISEMYHAMDGLIDSLTAFAKTQNQGIDCKKGCKWCCYQPVFALDYEMEYLNEYLNRSFVEEEKNQIKKRAELKNQNLEMLTETELLNSKFPCALLENGCCIAYQARPMACRIYLSGDLKSCLNFFHHPEDKDSYPALINLTLRCGQIMNEGFKAALKINGIKTGEFRIEEKLLEI